MVAPGDPFGLGDAAAMQQHRRHPTENPTNEPATEAQKSKPRDITVKVSCGRECPGPKEYDITISDSATVNEFVEKARNTTNTCQLFGWDADCSIKLTTGQMLELDESLASQGINDGAKFLMECKPRLKQEKWTSGGEVS